MRYWKDVGLGLIVLLSVPILLALFCGAMIVLACRRVYWALQRGSTAPAASGSSIG